MGEAKKYYPLNYPADVLAVIDALAFVPKNVVVAGSMALRSQLYAGDYDMFEIVRSDTSSKDKALDSFVSGFQKNIRQLLSLDNCYIGDIKVGEISEWKVISGDVRNGRVIDYDASAARDKIKHLLDTGIISKEEAEDSSFRIYNNPTPEQFLRMEKEIRPHIIRWSVQEVLKGSVKLRDGRTFTLADAFQTPSVCKVDAIALVQNNRFTDFSCLYTFVFKGKILNDSIKDAEHEIKKNIIYYADEGNYFKMAKRIFSILKRSKGELVDKLNTLFNSDLGRLYSLISDIGTLLFLLENESIIPLKKIQYEIGQFRARLGNIYNLPRVNTSNILSDILSLETTTQKSKMIQGLQELQKRLEGILDANAKKEMEKLKLLPVPSSLQP
jgi:hypothetical protein